MDGSEARGRHPTLSVRPECVPLQSRLLLCCLDRGLRGINPSTELVRLGSGLLRLPLPDDLGKGHQRLLVQVPVFLLCVVIQFNMDGLLLGLL